MCSTVGVLSTVWGVQYRGGILSTVGDVQYRGGYHDKCGGYLEYRGVFSTVGIIMSTMGLSLVLWGVILSTVGDVQYHGDIMMHVGDIMSTVEGVQYRGGKIF